MVKPTITEKDIKDAIYIVFSPLTRKDQGISHYSAVKKNNKWSLKTYFIINSSTGEIEILELNKNLSNGYIRKHFNDVMTEVNTYKLPYLLRISDYYKNLKTIKGSTNGDRYIDKF